MIQVWLSRPKTDGGCLLCAYDDPPNDNWTYTLSGISIRLCHKHRDELLSATPNMCAICHGAKQLRSGSGEYRRESVEKLVDCTHCLGTGEHQEGKDLEKWG